jgi:CYTH domain-containing protein
MIEIERKFLVTSTEFIKVAIRESRIVQGYLNSNSERTVRVRIKGDKGFLTIKGIGNETGLSRFEWEKEIPLEDAEQLLLLCEQGIIDKIRYEVAISNHLYEVDVFLGANEDLIIAEIELSNENESFEKPTWLGKEVTNDSRYYNAYLSTNPFKNWNL